MSPVVWAIEIGVDFEVWTADGQAMLACHPVYVFAHPTPAHKLVEMRRLVAHYGAAIAGGALVKTISVLQVVGT